MTRIIEDICGDLLVRWFVADNVFVIIPLPDRRAGGLTNQVDLPGNGGFECAHNGWDRPGHRFAELFNRRGTARDGGRGTARRAPTTTAIIQIIA